MSSSNSHAIGTAAFVSAMTANAAIAGVVLVLFCVARLVFKHIYGLRSEPVLAGKSVPFPPPKPTAGLFGWIRTVLTTPDEVFLRTADLDALMFTRFMLLCLKLFLAAGVLGVAIILPVNFTASAVPPAEPWGNVTSVALGDDSSSSAPVDDSFLEKLTLGNIPQGSHLLWVHVAFAYAFTFLALYLIRDEYEAWLALRHQWIMNQQLLTVSETDATPTGMGGQMTVMFEAIPPESGQSDDDLFTFFRSMYGDNVVAAICMRDTKRLDPLVTERSQLIADLQDAYDHYGHSGSRPRAWRCNPCNSVPCLSCCPDSTPCCCCTWRLCPSRVDAIDESQKRLNALNEAIDTDQRRPHKSMLSAFVTFSSARAVTWAAQAHHSAVPNKYIPSIAPNSKELYWPNVTVEPEQRPYRATTMFGVVVLMVFGWAVPVAFVSGLIALKSLEDKFHFLGEFLATRPALSDFLSGFLASLALVVFQSLLPAIVDLLARLEGLISESAIQKWCLQNLFIFQVINFFFLVIVGGSLLTIINQISFTDLPQLLGHSVPGVSSFFMLYIALLALSGFPLGLLNPIGVVLSYALFLIADSPRQKRNALLYAKQTFNYGASYPQHLLVFLIGATYAILSPLVLPFLVGYFALGALVHRYSFLYIFVNTFESGGIYWPSVASRMLAALFFSYITLIGVFSVKGGYYQSISMAPLFVVTYFFQSYVQDRFPKFADVLPVSLAQQVDDILEQRRAQAREFLGDAAADKKAAADKAAADDHKMHDHVPPSAHPSAFLPPFMTAGGSVGASSGDAGTVGSNAGGAAKRAQVYDSHGHASEFEYEHEPLQTIRATVDEDAEPKKVVSEREQRRLVARAYIQPSLIAPNRIVIVELSEEEKKRRAAEHPELEATNFLGGLKEALNPDAFRINRTRGPTVVVDSKADESRRRQSSAIYSALGFAISPSHSGSSSGGAATSPSAASATSPTSPGAPASPVPVPGAAPTPGASKMALMWAQMPNSFTSDSNVPPTGGAAAGSVGGPRLTAGLGTTPYGAGSVPGPAAVPLPQLNSGAAYRPQAPLAVDSSAKQPLLSTQFRS